MPRQLPKYLTLFNAVFELTPDGRLMVEVTGDDGAALYVDMTKAEVAQLRDLLAPIQVATRLQSPPKRSEATPAGIPG